MLKKFTIFLFCLLISLFLVVRTSWAEGEFVTDAYVEYKVQPGGVTTVTHTITLENVYTDIYATAYSFVLDSIDATNIKVTEAGKDVPFTATTEGSKTTLKIEFSDAIVGKGKTRTFIVSFENPNFAQRTGEVWEMSIPRLSAESSFRSYTVALSIPISFGNVAYMSPAPQSSKVIGGSQIYLFNKDAAAKTGVSAGFGEFQVFSFSLLYHLENPLTKPAYVDIAIPPDTSMQKLYYQVLDPKPETVYTDADGNWLARYLLSSRQRLDIKAAGNVQIFTGPRSFQEPDAETLKANLTPSDYWQTTDPEIVDLGQKLKTPRAIYDYVTSTLTYDYERVKPNVTRLGAKDALNNPKSATCMEFTDLFIAIARAAGIPAREINGYAYTENPKIQPLSLVADVLHAWPEYWDATNKVWVPVDPTWGETTGGVDYFSKLDLRHFTFVIHGKDAKEPFAPGSYKLGPNPQKDVYVNFGQLTSQEISKPEITLAAESLLFLPNGRFKINVKNPGPTALYNLTLSTFFDGKENGIRVISQLPPFGNFTTDESVPFNLNTKNVPAVVTLTVPGNTVSAPTFKNQLIICELLAVSLAILVIVILILVRIKRINFTAPASKVRSTVNLIVGKVSAKWKSH
jgi:hypothetical protein